MDENHKKIDKKLFNVDFFNILCCYFSKITSFQMVYENNINIKIRSLVMNYNG